MINDLVVSTSSIISLQIRADQELPASRINPACAATDNGTEDDDEILKSGYMIAYMRLDFASLNSFSQASGWSEYFLIDYTQFSFTSPYSTHIPIHERNSYLYQRMIPYSFYLQNYLILLILRLNPSRDYLKCPVGPKHLRFTSNEYISLSKHTNYLL